MIVLILIARRFILFAAFFVGVTSSAGVSKGSQCGRPGTHWIERPYFPEQLAGPKFRFSYLQVRKAAPGFPTVFELSGGPGQALIFDGRMLEIFANDLPIPRGVGLVMMDPRGVGCNRPPNGRPYPRDFYSTYAIATDALAAVNDLHVDSYILWGQSYGTMVATVAASLAERGAAPKPKFVILESVVGHGVRHSPVDDYAPILQEWSRVKRNFPADIVQLLKSQPKPGGLTGEELGSYIWTQLLTRWPHAPEIENSGVPDVNFEMLSLLRPGSDPKKFGEWVRDVKAQSQETHKSDLLTLAHYRTIMCREVSRAAFNTEMDYAFRLERGKIIPEPGNICRGIPFDRIYDSASWQTTVPLIYFVGGRDVSTPPTEARYHFQTHRGSPRIYVETPGAAHASLSVSLFNCFGEIFATLMNNQTGLEQALGRCEMKSNVLSVPAEAAPAK